MLNKEGSWIKIYRSLLDWEWYDDINTCRLFIHLLLTANYEDKKWHGMVIKRGQRFCSLSTLAEETGLSIKSIRVALTHLALTGEITKETARQGILLTLVKYEEFQGQGAYEGHTKGIQGAYEGHTKGNDIRIKEFNNTPLTPLKGGNAGGEKTETAGEETATLTPELINQKEGSAKGQAKGKREKKEKYFLALDEALDIIRHRVRDNELYETMEEWARMRYAKRGTKEHRLTEKAINDTFTTFERYGYNTADKAKACVEQSIVNNWDGMWPVK